MNPIDSVCVAIVSRAKRSIIEQRDRKLRIPSSSTLGDIGLGFEAEVSMGEHSYINSGYITGKVRIGSWCAIGYNVSLIGATHGVERPTGPQPIDLKRGEIVIGDSVWIRNNAVILPGITVGHHAVVGANAVVTRNIEPFNVVGGVPARVIKEMRL